MDESDLITYVFPGGVNSENSGMVINILFSKNQKVMKGEVLAIFSSENFQMEMEAEEDGIVIEIFVNEKQTIFQNDILWKIKTTYNTNYS